MDEEANRARFLSLLHRRKVVLDKFGPRVRYPQGGERLLLVWRSHNEGHNLIVAKSEESLFLTWRRTVERNNRADGNGSYDKVSPKEFRRITIVNLPEQLTVRLADNKYRVEMRQFADTLGYQIEDYRREHKWRLPPNTTACVNYQAEADDEDADPKTDKNHHRCVKCVRGVVPLIPIEEIFWTQRMADSKPVSRSAKGTRSRPDPELKPVQTIAVPYDESKEIYYAVQNGFSHGVGIYPMDGACVPTALFFFQGEPEPIPNEVASFVAEFDKKADAEYEARRKVSDREFKRRAEKQHEELLKTLGASKGQGST